jgi:hypothetical protein
LEIGAIARTFTGWGLEELRRMTVRERRYWWRTVTTGSDGEVLEFHPAREA